MKIAISSLGKTSKSQVDPRFGRCPYFIIADTNSEEFEAIENTAGQTFQGAGITAAQLVANKEVQAIIAGNFGPKAVNVLSQSNIKIFRSPSDINIKEVIRKFKNNKLEEIFPDNISLKKGDKACSA